MCVEDDNMEIHNMKYKNQGIHVIASIFTIEKGVLKILLIKRKNEMMMQYRILYHIWMVKLFLIVRLLS